MFVVTLSKKSICMCVFVFCETGEATRAVLEMQAKQDEKSTPNKDKDKGKK